MCMTSPLLPNCLGRRHWRVFPCSSKTRHPDPREFQSFLCARMDKGSSILRKVREKWVPQCWGQLGSR